MSKKEFERMQKAEIRLKDSRDKYMEVLKKNIGKYCKLDTSLYTPKELESQGTLKQYGIFKIKDVHYTPFGGVLYWCEVIIYRDAKNELKPAIVNKNRGSSIPHSLEPDKTLIIEENNLPKFDNVVIRYKTLIDARYNKIVLEKQIGTLAEDGYYHE